MIINNHSYEEQTRRLLADAKSELRTLDAEMGQLRVRRTALAHEVDAYEVALQGYLKRTGKHELAETKWDEILKPAGTHKERLKLIAEHSGGKIKVSQATDILFSKGYVKAQKRVTAYSVIHVILGEMVKKGILEKIAPGEYKLKPKAVEQTDFLAKRTEF